MDKCVKSITHLDNVYWPALRARILPHLPEKATVEEMDLIIHNAIALQLSHIHGATREALIAVERGKMCSFK